MNTTMKTKLKAELSGGGLSERCSRLKQRALSEKYYIDVERARYFTWAWREMGAEGVSRPCMRAARALEKTLRNVTIRIEDDELLVGVKGSRGLSEPLSVERGSFNNSFELLLHPRASRELTLPIGGLSKQRQDQLADIDEDSRRELMGEILPYWRGKTAMEYKLALWEQEGVYAGTPPLDPLSVHRLVKAMGGARKAVRQLTESIGGSIGVRSLKSLPLLPKIAKQVADLIPDQIITALNLQGHTVPGYKRVLDMGFKGIAALAEESLRLLEPGDADSRSKADFLESVMVSARAVCDYAVRYAELAEEMAAQAAESRKRELLAIAERCRRVPAEPPRTFMEALQSIWMTQVALYHSYGLDNVFSPGRLDQFLYPFYRADLEAGRISREEALEGLEELLIKLSTSLIFGPNNITIGGLSRDGEDATNEVSYLFLEALENIRGMGNGLAVRISQKTPREFLLRACAVNRHTAGVAFYNDEVVIRDLKADGYSLADARDYSIVGCVEPTSTGNDFSYTAGNVIWMVGVLEMALNRGRRLLTGYRRVGDNTPDPSTFRTFEDVKDAFAKQLKFTIAKLVRAAELKDLAFASFPTPLLSSTIEGCMESGRDITWGGAKYNNGHVNAQGLATVANSLAAIRWAVFEKKICTMEELVGHLRDNFRGAENLRQELLRKAPKYGNDDPRADELAVWVAEVFCEEVRKHRSWRGGIYRPSLFSSGTQDLEGAICGATPDGRRAGEPVSNGISPTNGTEWNGITAVFHSAAAAGSPLVSDGTALNLNLSPLAIASQEGLEKLASTVEAFFVLGGRHVQFNPLDRETLKDAQAHPERYPDLTVKVSGYSARFVELSRSLQDDIIKRTEFCEV